MEKIYRNRDTGAVISVSTKTDTPTVEYVLNNFTGQMSRIVPSVIEFSRKKKGWTQKQLAAKMKTAQSAIARAENHEKRGEWHKIGHRFYLKFAKAMGIGMQAASFAIQHDGGWEEIKSSASSSEHPNN